METPLSPQRTACVSGMSPSSYQRPSANISSTPQGAGDSPARPTVVSLSAVWIADVEIPSELVADRREGRGRP